MFCTPALCPLRSRRVSPTDGRGRGDTKQTARDDETTREMRLHARLGILARARPHELEDDDERLRDNDAAEEVTGVVAGERQVEQVTVLSG